MATEPRRRGRLPGRGDLVAALAALILAAPVAAAEPPVASPGPAGHGGPVRALGLIDDGRRLVSGGFDSTVLVWSLDRSTIERRLRHHDSTVNAVQALADGCFASGGEDARIAIWCGDDTVPTRVLTGHTAPIASLAASADGRTLVSAGWDHTVRVWRPLAPGPSLTAPLVIEGHRGPVNGVALLPGGDRIVSVGYDGTVRISQLADGAAIANRGLGTPLNAVAVATAGARQGQRTGPPGGSRHDDILIAAADGRLIVLSADLATVFERQLERGPLVTIAVSPDGARLATAGLRVPVTVIDRVTLDRAPRDGAGPIGVEILGPGLPVWSIAFAADGLSFVTGGIDGAIRRWTSATGAPFGPDVAAATDMPRTGDSEPGAVLFRACRACHSLTPGEAALAGPSLAGVFGRRVGSVADYSYSDALKRGDVVWDEATLARMFEVGPNAYLPGTKMPEQRITAPADRATLFEWLRRVTQ